MDYGSATFLSAWRKLFFFLHFLFALFACEIIQPNDVRSSFAHFDRWRLIHLNNYHSFYRKCSIDVYFTKRAKNNVHMLRVILFQISCIWCEQKKHSLDYEMITCLRGILWPLQNWREKRQSERRYDELTVFNSGWRLFYAWWEKKINSYGWNHFEWT